MKEKIFWRFSEGSLHVLWQGTYFYFHAGYLPQAYTHGFAKEARSMSTITEGDGGNNNEENSNRGNSNE